MTADDTDEKQQYALALLRHPDDPYKAALEVVGGDLARGLVMSREWPGDAEVVEYMSAELAAPTSYATVLTKVHTVGFDALAPSEKKTYIKQQLVQQAETRANMGKDAIAALKLLAEMEGFTGAGTTINNNTLVDQRKVMIVKDHGTDAEWEAKLIAQQAALTNDGASPAIN